MSLSCVMASAAIATFIAGAFGGWINYLRARAPDDLPSRHGLYYFLLSIAAAFSVPLFLSLTKSELLKNVLSTTAPLKAEDWFIFFAVCLIAAIYAQAFLDTVSKKVLEKVEAVERTVKETKSDVKEAKSDAKEAKSDAKEALNSTDAREQADEEIENPHDAKRVSAVSPERDLSAFSTDQQKVMRALLGSQYVRRSIGGISRDAQLSRQEVRAILTELIDRGAVVEGRGKQTGNIFYQARLDAPA